MAPSPVRKLIYTTGKKCFKAFKKLTHSRRQAEPEQCSIDERLTVQMPSRVSVTTSQVPRDEDSKSNVTTLTWLDDVRDLEDMENRLNEALEFKMKIRELTSN